MNAKLIVALVATLLAATLISSSSATASEEEFGAAAIEWLSEQEVLDGTDCSAESCEGTLSRWEAAVWIVRVLDLRPTFREPFVDVRHDSFYAGHVGRLYRAGVTVGCSVEPLRFCPDREVTRAHMASFLARAFDLPNAIPAGFEDVSSASAHAAHIDALYAAGITVGCSQEPKLYCPDTAITYRQAAVMLHRAVQRQEALKEADESDGGGSRRSGSAGTSSSTGGGTGSTGGASDTGGDSSSDSDSEDDLVQACEIECAQVLAVDFLAAWVTASPTELAVQEATSRTWPDGSIGCAVSGYAYTQGEEPGYRFRVSDAQNLDWYVHANKDGTILLIVDGDVDGSGPVTLQQASRPQILHAFHLRRAIATAVACGDSDPQHGVPAARDDCHLC